ncbi:6824_t:CDS:10 [Dentiscutata erythropus]|uniref:6824_t:CDS:1 n=1 Tax=Dentiscutata erythropus TaxID=1348616 RepID=A0A9N9G0D3_9GLOM|nr:6824_t:CDS:10 [Dentiscutata erythropus]
MQNSESLSINIPKPTSRKASIVSANIPSSPHFIQNNLSHDLNDILRGFVDELCEIFIEARQRGKPDTNTCKLFTDYLKSENQNVEQIFECLLNNTHRPEYTALLGYFYSKGIGTKPSFRKAYSLYLSEAKKDYFIAQDLVGDCYYLGRGTIRDCRMAFEWYQKAADNGSIGALTSLGMCYILGEEAANDSYKTTNKQAQKNKLQSKNAKKASPGKSKLSKTANTDSTRRSEPSNKNNSSSNNVKSSKNVNLNEIPLEPSNNVNLHETPSETSNNVNLHETPSESSNNVNLYELFSESSVEDNLLSNSDHLHELSSKSEVIDLEPSVESDLSLKTIDLRESSEEFSETIIPEPFDESNLSVETIDWHESSKEEPSEIIIPVETCSEPSVESEMSLKAICLRKSPLPEESSKIITPEPSDESNLSFETTDLHEPSSEQSSEIIIPVTPCPEPSVESSLPLETTDLHELSSEQSSEVIIPEPLIENNTPIETVEIINQVTSCPEPSVESTISLETTEPHEYSPVESSEIINQVTPCPEPSIESNIPSETTDLNKCPPVEPSETTNQEPEPSIENNSSPENADIHESSPKSPKIVDQGSSVETNPKPAPTKKKRKRCSKLEQVEKRINRRIKWYKKNLYDEVNYELLEDFPGWLRGCEMDKYSALFEGKRWQDIVKMKYKDLRELGVDHHESAWQLQSNFWIINCDLAAKKGKTLPYKGGVDRINIDLELMNDFPEYLKSINMEQYAPLFAGKNWKEIIDMDHKDLKALKIESVSHRIDMVKQFWVMRLNKCVLIPSKKRTKIPDMISEFEDPKEEVVQPNECDNKLE